MAAWAGTKRATASAVRSNQPRREVLGVAPGVGNWVEMILGVTEVVGGVTVVVGHVLVSAQVGGLGQVLVVVQSTLGQVLVCSQV